MPGRICFPKNVVYLGLLHWLHNNYSYLKICLQVAQLTNCYRKLNTTNHFRYGMREVKQIIQISNKTENKNILRLAHRWKNKRIQLRVNLPRSNRRKNCNTLFCLFNLFMYHFLNVLSEIISEDVLFVCSCIIHWVIVTPWHPKVTLWIRLHT